MYVLRLRSIIFYSVVGVLSLIVIIFGLVHLNFTPRISAVNGENSVALPIIMYHGITQNPSKIGTYVISATDFENDLKYIKDNGYTTVLLSDVIDYVEGKKDLPEKPIVLTFDDGFRNNLEYGLPLLEKYNMKAVVSIVGIYSEEYAKTDDKNPDYAYLDWTDINTLKDSGRIEIDNHTYDMHMLPKEKENKEGRKGASKKSGETDSVYIEKLTKDAEKTQNLLRENCDITPLVFTYPYGELCTISESTLKDLGFKATLSCMEKINYITPNNPDCLFCMCRYLRSDKKSVAQIISNIK